ncbi:unnamed protein product [Cochlearia groenlandica]
MIGFFDRFIEELFMVCDIVHSFYSLSSSSSKPEGEIQFHIIQKSKALSISDESLTGSLNSDDPDFGSQKMRHRGDEQSEQVDSDNGEEDGSDEGSEQDEAFEESYHSSEDEGKLHMLTLIQVACPEESHTDDVTQVHFAPTNNNTLLTGGFSMCRTCHEKKGEELDATGAKARKALQEKRNGCQCIMPSPYKCLGSVALVLLP